MLFKCILGLGYRRPRSAIQLLKFLTYLYPCKHYRRKTGAFKPKDVCQKQLLTDARGYRLRDTDERINRLQEDGGQVKNSQDGSERKGSKGNKDIGPPLNHMGTDHSITYTNLFK